MNGPPLLLNGWGLAKLNEVCLSHGDLEQELNRPPVRQGRAAFRGEHSHACSFFTSLFFFSSFSILTFSSDNVECVHALFLLENLAKR